MKIKSLKNYVDLDKLYMINEYVGCSKVFFDNLDKFIENCDTTNVDDLVNFYCNVRLEYKKMKEVCLSKNDK